MKAWPIAIYAVKSIYHRCWAQGVQCVSWPLWAKQLLDQSNRSVSKTSGWYYRRGLAVAIACSPAVQVFERPRLDATVVRSAETHVEILVPENVNDAGDANDP